MSKVTREKINGDKLMRAFEIRKLDHKACASEIGYSPKYFTDCKNKGLISKVAVIALDNSYGIKFDEYAAQPEIIKVMECDPEDPELDYEKLSEAVCEGVKKALREVETQKLWKAIYTAVRAATRGQIETDTEEETDI